MAVYKNMLMYKMAIISTSVLFFNHLKSKMYKKMFRLGKLPAVSVFII